jgi:hypothetical protein
VFFIFVFKILLIDDDSLQRYGKYWMKIRKVRLKKSIFILFSLLHKLLGRRLISSNKYNKYHHYNENFHFHFHFGFDSHKKNSKH